MRSLEQFELELYCAGLIKYAENKPDRMRAYTEAYNLFFSRVGSHPQFNLDNSAYIKYSKNLADRLLKIIKISNITNNKIIEFGSGRGFLIANLAERFPDIDCIGIDVAINEELHNFKNLSFFKKNFLNEANSTIEADFVISDQVIEHIHLSDIDDFMNTLKSSIKIGGHLFIGTPNSIWGPHDISGVFNFKKPVGFPLYEYNSRELISLCKKYDLKFKSAIIMLRNYGFTLSELQYRLIESIVALFPHKLKTILRENRLLGWANIRFVFIRL